MRATIIIPVHNRKQTTLRCLHSLRAARLPADFGIVVVDDGSTDGTGAAIAAEFPSVVVERGNGELYWTGGITLGMKRALAEGAEFLFWLNDDCIPEPEALPRMLRHLGQNPRSICGAACFLPGATEAEPTAFRGRRDVGPSGPETEVDGLNGYCVGMPANVCKDIGFPDERRLPHYGADSIYTLKARHAGYRISLLAEARAHLSDGNKAQNLAGLASSSRQKFGAFVRVTFFHRKSPFYLRGQYWYHRFKYGFFLGSLLFLVKCLRWAWVLATHWHRRPRPEARATLGTR